MLQNTATWSAYAEDLKYLIMNKTFMMITVGFTALTFFTGSLAFWAPSFIEDALVVGNVTDGTDPPIAQERYRVAHLNSEHCLLTSNQKFCHSTNFISLSATLTYMSIKGCPDQMDNPVVLISPDFWDLLTLSCTV